MIGLIIVAVIIAIVLMSQMSRPAPAATPSGTIPSSAQPQPVAGSGWKRYSALDLVGGIVAPMTSNNSVKYLGSFATEEKCMNACVAPDCMAYTWSDGNGGDYANQCYGMKVPPSRIVANGFYSGERIEKFDTQHCIGTFDCLNEPFSSSSCIGTFDCMSLVPEEFQSRADVAANTMFAGYQGPSVLPV
jgi:hypothetical protein